MPLGREVRLGPGDVMLDGDPAPPTKGGTAAPTFRPMSVVAKRSPVSATAEHLLVFLNVFGLEMQTDETLKYKMIVCERLNVRASSKLGAAATAMSV